MKYIGTYTIQLLAIFYAPTSFLYMHKRPEVMYSPAFFKDVVTLVG